MAEKRKQGANGTFVLYTLFNPRKLEMDFFFNSRASAESILTRFYLSFFWGNLVSSSFEHDERSLYRWWCLVGRERDHTVKMRKIYSVNKFIRKSDVLIFLCFLSSFQYGNLSFDNKTKRESLLPGPESDLKCLNSFYDTVCVKCNFFKIAMYYAPRIE